MSRATKNDPFFIYAAKANGYWKGKRLIGVNRTYEGDVGQLTLQDLLSFLNKHDVDPADVKIDQSFLTYAKVK